MFHNIGTFFWVDHKVQDIVTIVFRVFMWKQFGYLGIRRGHYVNNLKEIGFGYAVRIKLAEVQV